MGFSDLAGGVLDACKSTFGETVLYTPQGSSQISIQGIFSKASYEIDPNSGLTVLTNKPTLGIKIADLDGPQPKLGDLITVRTVNYKVSNLSLDGEGGAALVLAKA